MDRAEDHTEPTAELVHGLANHVGALLLGIDLMREVPELPAHVTATLTSMLEEARAAARLVALLQEGGADWCPTPDDRAPHDDAAGRAGGVT